jgi:hypothetical protein
MPGLAGCWAVRLADRARGGECGLGEIVIDCGVDAVAASVVGGVSVAVVGQ